MLVVPVLSFVFSFNNINMMLDSLFVVYIDSFYFVCI